MRDGRWARGELQRDFWGYPGDGWRARPQAGSPCSNVRLCLGSPHPHSKLGPGPGGGHVDHIPHLQDLYCLQRMSSPAC